MARAQGCPHTRTRALPAHAAPTLMPTAHTMITILATTIFMRVTAEGEASHARWMGLCSLFATACKGAVSQLPRLALQH